jgi:hypothetical protein
VQPRWSAQEGREWDGGQRNERDKRVSFSIGFQENGRREDDLGLARSSRDAGPCCSLDG